MIPGEFSRGDVGRTQHTSFIRLLYTLAPFTSYTRFTTLTHGFTHWATSGLADCRITDSQLTREYVHTLRRTTTDRTHTTDWLNLEELTTDHSWLENTFTLMEEQQLWHWDRARIYIPQMVEGLRTNKSENFLKKNNPIHLSQIAPSCRLSLRTLQGLDRGDSSYSQYDRMSLSDVYGTCPTRAAAGLSLFGHSSPQKARNSILNLVKL